MSDCKYCGGNCPEQVDKNGEPREGFICNGYAVNTVAVRESTITTLSKGEFVMVDMVDETIELGDRNINIYGYKKN